MQSWTPFEAAQAAGARKQDVFMGIDVFGRSSYAGGELNCNIAAAAAAREGALLPYLARYEIDDAVYP